MKHYLVTAKITIGGLEQSEQILVEAANERHAAHQGYESVRRGPLDSTDSGYYDLGGEIHLEVIRVDEVAPEHLPILQYYLEGKPLPTKPKGWHVSWEIDFDRYEGETPLDAAMAAAWVAIDQFMKLVGRSPGASATKPALTINGQLIDFEQDQ